MVISNIFRILTTVLILSNGESPYELFSIGNQLEMEGKIQEAIEYYKRVKELDPGALENYISLANALYKIQRYDEGISFAQEGLLIAPDDLQLHILIAFGYIAKRSLEKAIAYYEKAVKIAPDNIDTYATLSKLYEATRQFKKAIEILEGMPEELMTSDVFVNLGALAGKMYDHMAAIEYYRSGYSLDTTNITALIGMGTGFDMLGIKDSAIYYYEKAIADTMDLNINKRLVDLYTDTDQYEKVVQTANEILKHDYNDVHIRRSMGFAFYKLGLFESALDAFFITSKIDPQDTYSRFYAGRIYFEQGNYDAALQEIKEAIKINPNFLELWIYHGFISINKADYKNAEYAFTEAAYRGGDMIQIYYLLGVVLEMQNEYSGAYFYYHKALNKDPDNLASLEALANLCQRIEKDDEAFERYQKIIELDSTNAIALNYVGYTYAERNDSLEYALELIDRALFLDGENGYYIDSRGWVFYQMGRYEEALVELKRAAEIVDDAVVLEHLGDAYVQLNDMESALETYLRALEHDPENKILKKKIKKIED